MLDKRRAEMMALQLADLRVALMAVYLAVTLAVYSAGRMVVHSVLG